MSRGVQAVKYFIYGLVGVLPVALTLGDVIGLPSRVTGSSMKPTLNPVGSLHNDIVWLSKIGTHQLHSGDIVAIRSPVAPDNCLVKRVVAVEGELLSTLSYKQRIVEVPKGHIWVEGDNTRSSQDSNFFGPVSTGLVLGKATHILCPINRSRKLRPLLTEDQQQRKF